MLKTSRLGALAAAGALVAFGAAAQTAPAPWTPPPGPATSPLQVRPVAPGVYWVQGGIGNVGIIVGRSSVALIDTTIYPASGKELIAAVAKITPKPIRTIILTHGDRDHVGGLAAFPAGLTIIAHDKTKARVTAAATAGRSTVPPDRVPTRGVGDHTGVDLDGVKAELFHWAPAHTDGDLIIYLPAQKIVFTGDIFNMNQPRANIHREQDGTSDGWVTTAKGMLALDSNRYVVGHGGVETKATLQHRVDLVVAEKARIKELVAQGKTLAEIETEVGDPPPDWPAPEAGAPKVPPFAENVYGELTGK